MKKLALALAFLATQVNATELVNIKSWACNTANTACQLNTDDAQIISATFLSTNGSLTINEIDVNGNVVTTSEASPVVYTQATKLTTYQQVIPWTVTYPSGSVLSGQISRVKNPRTGGWTTNWWFFNLVQP